MVAKLHKLHDRAGSPGRLDDKDAHDVYRLLQAVETDVVVEATERLLQADISSDVTREGLDYLNELFARGPRALGSQMAGRAEELVGNPAEVSESVALLAQDLIEALRR